MNYRRVRSWNFGKCVFDEANWLLTVNGQRVAVEGKPLELLRELLLRAGSLVSKAELLDAIWPDTAVVEASLPTAIHKLRLALHDDHRDTPIIETVPRIGYRLAVPVEVKELDVAPRPLVSVYQSCATNPFPTAGVAPAIAGRVSTGARLRLLVLGGGLIIASALVAAALWTSHQIAPSIPRVFSNREAIIALRRLDVAKIDTMIASGWNPDAPLDTDGNNALNRLLEMCEWDPGHDRPKMLLVARALLDGGVTLDRHNLWGDTPYSIANEKRYCGPDHPVTQMIRNMCYAHGKMKGDRCLAHYATSTPNRGKA